MRIGLSSAALVISCAACHAVTMSADGKGGWNVIGNNYAAFVGRDGCLRALKVNGIETIDSHTGISRGVYLWRNNKPESFGSATPTDPTTLTAASDACQLDYRFGEESLELALTDRTGGGLVLTAVFGETLRAVAVDDAALQSARANANASRATLVFGDATLILDGKSRFFGPWGKGNQVMTGNVPASGASTWKLSFSETDAETSSAMAALPPLSAESTDPISIGPVRRVEIEKRYLDDVPAVFPTDDATAEGVTSIYYEGPDFHGKKSRVFAYYAIPKAEPAGKVPAMVLVHGGLGTAHAEWVRLWASRGYAAIAMDVCGCLPVRVDDQNGRWKRLESDGGPRGWDASYQQLGEGMEDQWPYYAVNAIARARTLIGSFPEVDDARVGLTGISWGGTLTCLTAGLDDRYRFAVPVYACGFLRERSAWADKLNEPWLLRWTDQFDPSHYLPKAKMPLLWVTGTNDRFFPIKSLTKSAALPPTPVTMCVKLRMTHSQDAGATPAEIGWYADSFCRNGDPLLRLERPVVHADAAVSAQWTSERPPARATLLSTDATGAYEQWKWTETGAVIDTTAKTVSAKLPGGTRWWLLSTTDSRGGMVTTLPQETDCFFGSRIPRTMRKLATATPEHPSAVDILFYGQSITAQAWTGTVGAELAKRHPAAKLTTRNLAIGGFEAPTLLRVSELDVYPRYPDLIVFHVYGGHVTGELEQMVAGFRKRTTSEIMLATHHFRATPTDDAQRRKIAEVDVAGSEKMRELAEKYACELVDVREGWQTEMEKRGVAPEFFLKDSIHLNEEGNRLMADLVLSHFQYLPGAVNALSECLSTVVVPQTADGTFTLPFDGNRVDVVWGRDAASPNAACEIRVDGKKPSTMPELLFFTRPGNAAPGAWWPGLLRIGGNALSSEEWTLVIESINASATEFTFSVSGSVTGPDGTGNGKTRFVSDSGRIVIEPGDWRLAMVPAVLKKTVPVGTTYTWRSAVNGIDVLTAADIHPDVPCTLVSGLGNTNHVLTLTNIDTLPVKALVVHRPPLK